MWWIIVSILPKVNPQAGRSQGVRGRQVSGRYPVQRKGPTRAGRETSAIVDSFLFSLLFPRIVMCEPLYPSFPLIIKGGSSQMNQH